MIVKIYTMTHKKFQEPEDRIYIPLHVGRAKADNLGYLGDDTGESISEWNNYYGELTGVYWAWKNEKSADIVGICHYRRFFVNGQSQLLSQKDYEEILQDYDIIVPHSVHIDKSYLDYYGDAHNKQDLLLVGQVIKEKYPEYEPYFWEAVQGNTYYYGNLMAASWKWFQAYAQWLFDILFEVEKRINVESYDLYHQRVFGFLSEQMIKIWIEKNNLRVYEGTINITSEKAETIELKFAMSKLVKSNQIARARELFYKYLELRPDLGYEMSDIKGEIPAIEQLLYIAWEEERHNVRGLRDYSDDLNQWIEHYGRVLECLEHFSKGQIEGTDRAYILEHNVSWIMAKVMLMDDISSVKGDCALALQKFYEIHDLRDSRKP